MEIEINQLQSKQFLTANDGAKITVKGWVKSNRNSSKIGFLTVNDGSSLNSLQIVYTNETTDWVKLAAITTGSAVIVTGTLKITTKGQQPYELKFTNLDYCNLAFSHYPIQKKAHSYEFLRNHAELRPRTDTFYAIFKIRNQIMDSIHHFFQSKHFIYLNSPLITANDAEGAGENFIVTTIKNDDYESDFFGKKATLTVSGQLNAEAYAQAFRKVYTFGPTFRAEKSHTTRHAAEFWMIEPECAFASLNDNIQLAKEMLAFVITNLLAKCETELTFLNQKLAKENPHHQDLFAKLQPLQELQNFKTITYSEVIDLLIKAQNGGKQFEFNEIKWGIDLQSEHERYLCEEVMQAPTFVVDYPQAIKAFYMKVNQSSPKDQRTVAAMDLLIPGVGELIGGSVREDSYQQLVANQKLFNLNQTDLAWYFDLRKYGYAPSAGFGLGLERLIMFVTGMNNIRDVIAFPRTPNNLNF